LHRLSGTGNMPRSVLVGQQKRMSKTTQKLLLDMAKAWANVALVEADVTKQAAVDKFVGNAPH
jgi:hypothetical protein